MLPYTRGGGVEMFWHNKEVFEIGEEVYLVLLPKTKVIKVILLQKGKPGYWIVKDDKYDDYAEVREIDLRKIEG